MVVIFAYADPPYLGQAKKHYSHDPQCAEVDHDELIARLVAQYPDGWALSCSSPSLRHIISLCPDSVRVCAWVKPFAVFKPNVGVAYAWEPLILFGGRKRTRQQPTVRDWLAESITLRRGLVGAKPEAFALWLFEMWNAHEGDDFHDLFPGTGGMARAWDSFVRRPVLTLPLEDATA